MEEIINAFGLDVRLIVIQIVNFGILMAALGYFLYTPILKIIQERQERIAQGVKDAEAAAVAKASANEEKQTVLSAAHHEAEAIGVRARSAADETAQELLKEAHDKADRIVHEAEARGEDIKVQAKAASEADIAKSAVLAAEKILRERTS